MSWLFPVGVVWFMLGMSFMADDDNDSLAMIYTFLGVTFMVLGLS